MASNRMMNWVWRGESRQTAAETRAVSQRLGRLRRSEALPEVVPGAWPWTHAVALELCDLASSLPHHLAP